MSDDPKPHSGSRWEPTPDGSDPAVDPEGEAAHHPSEPSPPTEEIPAASEAGAAEPDPRRGWRRPLLLAAVAVGLVLGSGLGGFVIGQATAGIDPTRIGLVGDAGGFGTHRGGPPGVGGLQRDQDGGGSAPDGSAPDGTGTGTQSSGAGANGTSAST